MRHGYLHAPEITDEVIQKAFEGTNFGRTDYREFLGYSVLEKACGWHCGYTITKIMIELGLITPKTHIPTKLGKMFLSDCYDDPRRVSPAPSAPECQWTFDESQYSWNSACGEEWLFTDGGPVENRVKFCQGCGGAVKLPAAPEQ